jgi:hypothetical protein
MNTTRIAALVLALSGAACATAGGSTAPKVDRVRLADGSYVVCQMELPTGSHIRERVCRPERAQTVEEKEAIRQLVQPPAKVLTPGS